MSEITERYVYDESEEKLHIVYEQDVEAILEANKRAFNACPTTHKSETFNHKAKIPDLIWQKWCTDKGIKHQEFLSNPKVLRRFLDDPDNKMCLTRPNKKIWTEVDINKAKGLYS